MSKYRRLIKINHRRHYHHNSGPPSEQLGQVCSSTASGGPMKRVSSRRIEAKLRNRLTDSVERVEEEETGVISVSNCLGKQMGSAEDLTMEPLLSTRSVANMISSKDYNHELNEEIERVVAKKQPIERQKQQQHQRQHYGTRANVLKQKQQQQQQLRQQFAFLTITLTIILILSIFINQVYTLNCYHCSSADNPSCDEAFTGRSNFTETNCEKLIGKPAKVCRKIVQYIEHKKVVIRSCGYIDETPKQKGYSTSLTSSASPLQQEHEHNELDLAKRSVCHKRSGTFAIMMESCNCYTDNCNHSTSLVPNQSVLFLASCSSVILLYHLVSRRTNNFSPQ